MGHSAMMSFILHPFTYMDLKTETLIVIYAAFQIFSILVLIFLVNQFLHQSFSVDYPSRLLRSIFSIITVTCVASTMLVNGFAPYFWCLVLILFWINFEAKNKNRLLRNLSLSLCIYSVSQITPAPATLLFFPALVYSIQEFRVNLNTNEIGRIIKNICPFILFGALTLFSFQNSSAGLGWRQLLQPGGLQNINLVTTTSLFAITLTLLILNRRNVLNDPLALIVISGMASSGALSILTLLCTGNLQYYAIKQIYLTLFLSSIYTVINLNISRIKFFVNGVILSLLIYPMAFPIFYTAGYMGVLPNVIVHTFSTTGWSTDPVNAELILQINKMPADIGNKCLIWRANDQFTDKDLSSRWLNAIVSRKIISEECFSAYWNNGVLSESELKEKLEKIDNDFLIFIDGPINQDVTQNIQFMEIPQSR